MFVYGLLFSPIAVAISCVIVSLFIPLLFCLIIFAITLFLFIDALALVIGPRSCVAGVYARVVTVFPPFLLLLYRHSFLSYPVRFLSFILLPGYCYGTAVVLLWRYCLLYYCHGRRLFPTAVSSPSSFQASAFVPVFAAVGIVPATLGN